MAAGDDGAPAVVAPAKPATVGASISPAAATTAPRCPDFEYEAEDSTVASVMGGTVLTWANPTVNTENNGTPLATFEALEASGRSAVRLKGTGAEHLVHPQAPREFDRRPLFDSRQC